MTDHKLPSLQNVILPKNGNVIVLNKDKVRPQVQIDQSELPLGTKVVGRKSDEFKSDNANFYLANPSPYHTHVWVYAINSGPYALEYKEGDITKTISGQKGFEDLLKNKNLVQNKIYSGLVEKNQHVISVPADKLEHLKIKKMFNSYSVISKVNGTDVVDKGYEDEFTIFAFAYGDENSVKTLPTTITLQDSWRDIPKAEILNISDRRNYIWNADYNAESMILGSFLGPYCVLNSYNSEKYNFYYLESIIVRDIKFEWDEIEYKEKKFKAYPQDYFGAHRSYTKFVVEKKESSDFYRNNTTPVASIDTSHYHLYKKVPDRFDVGDIEIDLGFDYGSAFLETDVYIYDGLSPEIDAFNVVVNDTREFQLPREAIDVIDHHAWALKNIKTYYYVPKNDAVAVYPQGEKQQIIYGSWGSAVIDNRLKVNQIYDFSLDQIYNLTWQFDSSCKTQGRHPEIWLSLSFEPITAKSLRTVKVLYNDTPEIIWDNKTAYLWEVGTFDRNGDDIIAIKLDLDSKYQNQVALVAQDKEYIIGSEGILYDSKDRFAQGGNPGLNLKWIGQAAKPADGKVGVSISAYDPYGQGKAQHLNITMLE